MREPSGKIKVFISSKMGETAADQKYILARKAVKEILESTKLFEIYSFEDEGASTRSAKDHYTQGLESSDVCIFLIDNKDGVPDGVKSELNTVDKHKIPALYYFCNKNKKKKTKVQLDLERAHLPKHITVNSFENFIEICPSDLIEDVLDTFKLSGKNESTPLSSKRNPLLDEGDSDTKLTVVPDNTDISFLTKKVLQNQECRNYFSSLLLNNEMYDASDANKDLDYYCTKFLGTMFQGISIENFNMNLLLSSLHQILPTTYYEIVEKRWIANQKYYLQEYDESLELLTEAYNLANKNKGNISEWLIQDILIDLRNRENKILETKNQYNANNFGQKEIDKRDIRYFYPIIDKNEKDLLNWIEIQRQKNEIRPYSSWSSYGDLSYVTNYIADFYYQAMLFGSFTQLSRVYSLVQKFSYQMSRATGYWPSILMMVKTSIINLDHKSVKNITRDFSDVLRKMNDLDAKEIFDFTTNLVPIEDQLIAKLIAMSEIGYYLSDKDFKRNWDEIEKSIHSWIKAENSMVVLETYIFNCIKRINERLDDNYIVELSTEIITSNKKRYHDSALDLLSQRYVNYQEVSQDKSNKLVDVMVKYAEGITDNNQMLKIKAIFILLKNIDENHLMRLESFIQTEWHDFYQTEYLFEKSRDNTSKTLILKEFARDIEDRNVSQGINGSYSLHATNPYINAINVIESSTNKIDDDILNDLFKAATNSILVDNQIMIDKFNAYRLTIYLIRSYPSLIVQNRDIIKRLTKNSNFDQAREMMFNHMDVSVLVFANLLLLECLGKNKFIDIVEVVTSFSEASSIIGGCRLIRDFLRNLENNPIRGTIETFFFQCSLLWQNSENLDVRWHNIRFQLKLYQSKKYRKSIGDSLYLTMKNDNSIIKSQLLHELKLIDQYHSSLGRIFENWQKMIVTL
nr:DUF4062 domain-containing protein [Enterococcus innesii]